MSKRKATKEFIADAIKKHGNKYDYSHVEYKGATAFVTIICPIHGEFQQRAADHINGHGCKKCVYEQKALQQAKSADTFISQANVIHKNKYDYTKIKYINSHTPITIVCPIHGEFYQQPAYHLRGHGCSLCSTDKHKGISLTGVTNSLYGVRQEKSYIVWHNLLQRTLNNNRKQNLPTYEDCKLCDEWKDYATFKEWYYNPINGYKEGYQLDKDLLVPGNKTYSPDTCCFLPKYINIFFRERIKTDGLPKGVKRNGNKYQARFMKKGKLFLFKGETPEEAFTKYKEAKEQYIKEMASEYYSRGEITEKVYNALMCYKVQMYDKYCLENLI